MRRLGDFVFQECTKCMLRFWKDKGTNWCIFSFSKGHPMRKLEFSTGAFQAWDFIFERARPFPFCKGHFHWKMLRSMANFWRGTKAKTRGQQRPPPWPVCNSRPAIWRAPRQWPGGMEAIALVIWSPPWYLRPGFCFKSSQPSVVSLMCMYSTNVGERQMFLNPPKTRTITHRRHFTKATKMYSRSLIGQ